MRDKILIIIIIILALTLRFWQLGDIPPSPNWDEVSLGYNAYSILETGRDEFGSRFPLILRSFDDYKPAFYAYLSIPFIKFFGLNTFSIRLPSAVFGVIAVFIAYLIIKELIKEEQGAKSLSSYLPHLVCFLLAVSSWHIQFSRVAFEANVALTFNLLGLYFFLKGLLKRSFFFLSVFFFSLSICLYQSEKVFVPIFLFILILLYRKELVSLKKKIIWPILLLFALTLPFYWTTFTTPNALLRAKGVSIFADQTKFLAKTAERIERDNKEHNILGKVFDNRRITYALAIADSYFSHFNLNWLFVTGDLARHQAPNMGHLSLWELPFLFLGIYSLVFYFFPRRVKFLIVLWFFTAPIPAAITTGVPHPVRTLNFLPTFQILTALGIVWFALFIQKINLNRIIKMAIGILFMGAFIFNFLFYLDMYFVQYNYFNSEYWQYGYKETVSYVKQIEKDYKQIIVGNDPPLEQSYMFFLFFSKYDPGQYLKEGGTKSGGFAEENKFAKYTFRSINWEKETRSSEYLFVGSSKEIPSSARILKTINYLNGQPAIYVAVGG